MLMSVISACREGQRAVAVVSGAGRLESSHASTVSSAISTNSKSRICLTSFEGSMAAGLNRPCVSREPWSGSVLTGLDP